MKTPDWFPFLGWTDIPDKAREMLGLDAQHKWEGFVLQWFRVGFLFLTRVKKNG